MALENVKKFTEKPYKKYRCGKRAEQVKRVLAEAFTVCTPEKAAEETAEFKKALDIIMQTKTGRDVLDKLSKLGYSFTYETGKFGGVCNSSEKKILINPSFGFNYMLPTIVHEGIHAIQSSLVKKNSNLSGTRICAQTSSILKFSRAMEADACAHQAAFTYQVKDIWPSVYEEAAGYNFPMLGRYVAEMEKSGDEKKAMQESFKAWYGCEYYQNYYDKGHKEWIRKTRDLGIKYQDPDLLSLKYEDKEIAGVCRYKGAPYIEPEFLSSPAAFAVPAEDRKEMAGWARELFEKVPGAKLDTSVLEMYTREKKEKGADKKPKTAGKKDALAAKALSEKKSR